MAVLVALAPRLASAEAKLLTLGAALPLTGSSASLGRYFRDGYEIAIDRINEKGGLMIGEDTYRLALKLLDNQSDSARDAPQYTELVTKDRVDFLLGPYSSSDTLEAAAVAERHHVLLVEAGGASGDIFSRGYRYVFGMIPAAENYFASTIEMMAKLDPRPRTVALIVADDPFDAAVGDGARRRAAAAGFDIVLDLGYSNREADFGALLAQVRAKAPDAILWGGHEGAARRFLREAKRMDVNPRYLASMTVSVPSASFRAALGKDAEYAFGMTPWVPSPLLRDRWFGDGQQFTQAFERRFGYEPDYHVAAAVAAVETFAAALEAAATTETDKVRDMIAARESESLYATTRFAPNGQIDLPQIVVQVQDGKIVPIYTDHFLNKPRYPVPGWSSRN
jgi:branched-chain amino acid transport system substrate-binding protein